MPPSNNNTTRIEAATIEDLDELVDLVTSLLDEELDFEPDHERQEHGLRLILEQPNRGRIFVLRNDHSIIGMASLLFTISTATGGFAINLEDVIVHPDHRGQGYGTQILNYAVDFARRKDFTRITILTDRVSEQSQRFFSRHGFSMSKMVPMRLMISRE